MGVDCPRWYKKKSRVWPTFPMCMSVWPCRNMIFR